MNTKKDWLATLKTTFESHKSGCFTAKDVLGNPVILEWCVTDILSPRLATFKRNVSELAAQNTAATEVAFLQRYPEAAKQEFLLKPCTQLLTQGVTTADWQEIEDVIKKTVAEFYKTDVSTFGPQVLEPLLEDLYLAIVAKDPSDSLLGFALFAVTPALAHGEVKLVHASAAPQTRGRGIEKLLLSMAPKLMPALSHIFTGIRPTDTHALEFLTGCGFVPEATPQDPNHRVNEAYFTFLGYRTDHSTSLQNIATAMISGVHVEAQEYDKRAMELIKMVYEPGFLSQGGIKEMDAMLSEIDLDGLRLLDIGCGLGGPDFYLAKKYAVDVVGIDPQTAVIREAQETLRSTPPESLKGKIAFIKMQNPANLSQFSDSSFDIALAMEAIMNIPIEVKTSFFREIYRVLKPDGRLIILDWMQGTKKNHGLPFHLITKEAFQKALTEAGFTNIQFTETTSHRINVTQQHIETLVNKAAEIKKQFGEEMYQNAMQGTSYILDAFKNREFCIGFFRAEK